MSSTYSPLALDFRSVSLDIEGRAILTDINWSVYGDQRWVVLGPNGAGKSTLLRLAASVLHPSSGRLIILGQKLGRVDVFELRPRVGYVSSGVAKKIPAAEKVIDVLLTAAWAVFGRFRESYESLDTRRARRVLAEWQLDNFADRAFGSLSDGQRQRVLIARAVMTDPEILLLDEPLLSLDLGAREELIGLLAGYASSASSPALVLVTHRLEEIPEGFGEALLLAGGRVFSRGGITEVLTGENLSQAFGLEMEVGSEAGRFWARRRA